MLNMLQLLIYQNVIRRNIFHRTIFPNSALYPLTILFFVVDLKAKITCITVNCVVHFMTAGLTVSLGVVGVFIQT